MWVNPEWLAELPYWFSYTTMHYRGIYLLDWLALCANLVFLYWRGYRRSGHAGAAWWAAALGFVLVSVNAGPRTIVLAYLAMGAELAILEAWERGNSRFLWLLPPLFCIWVNLHGSWLIGLATLRSLHPVWLVRIQQRRDRTGRHSRPQERNACLPSSLLCVVALMVNPYGWRLVWNPIDMMTNQKLNIANVMEWKPLNLSTMAGAAAFGAMCLMARAERVQGSQMARLRTRIRLLRLVRRPRSHALSLHGRGLDHSDPGGRYPARLRARVGRKDDPRRERIHGRCGARS